MKIATHLLRLLNIPSVRDRALNDLWQPILETMSETISSEPTDAYVKCGKRIVMLLGQIKALADEKQDTTIDELAEKAADQLVQIVAKQCSGSKSTYLLSMPI